MKSIDLNTTIIDGYMMLLNNLNPVNKLELISKLSDSVKNNLTPPQNSFKKAFGAFESSKSAEEIIADIRDSRIFNREIESF